MRAITRQSCTHASKSGSTITCVVYPKAMVFLFSRGSTKNEFFAPIIQSPDPMNTLPRETLQEILDRIPVEDQPTPRLTCRLFAEIIPLSPEYQLYLGITRDDPELVAAAIARKPELGHNICMRAAAQGSLEVLKWARSKNYPMYTQVDDLTATNGHLHILEWAHQNGYPWNPRTCANAAANGHLHILKWTHQNGHSGDVEVCPRAAEHGHLHILEWVHQNNHPWDGWTFYYAAKNGDLRILEWLRINGCPWDARVCLSAATYGHLHVLKWARANSYPWSSYTCSYAAGSGHLHVLQWAVTNGCPWIPKVCLTASDRYPHIQEWIRGQMTKKI